MTTGATPGSRVAVGSTRQLPAGSDYDAFCDGVADVYVGVRPERPATGRFAADYALYAFEPFAVGIISTPGVDAHRDRRSLSQLADDAFFVNHSPRAWALRQHGVEHHVAGGDATVLDNAAPFSVCADPRRRLDLVSVRLPRELLTPRTRADPRGLVDRLGASSWGRRLGAQTALLAAAVRDDAPGLVRAMGAAIVELLDTAATRTDPP